MVNKQRIEKYFSITRRALALAKESGNRTSFDRSDIIDMVERYLADAVHFLNEERLDDCFAALNYAHGWLDCAARLGIFDVHDSTLFTVD